MEFKNRSGCSTAVFICNRLYYFEGLIPNKFNTAKPNIIEITIIPKTIAVLTVGLSGFGLPNLPILYELNSQIKRNASGNAIRPPNSPNSVRINLIQAISFQARFLLL